LGQPEQSGAGAGPTGKLFGSGEGLFGPSQVPEPPTDVADLRVGGDRVGKMTFQQLRAGPGCFPFRRFKGALTFEHYSAMDPTDAREYGERMLCRPGHGGLGPLGRPAEVSQLLACADHAAINLPGRVRPEPAFDRQEHGFVQMGKAGLGLAGVEEDSAQGLEGLSVEIS
jgi:hypothetical protein